MPWLAMNRIALVAEDPGEPLALLGVEGGAGVVVVVGDLAHHADLGLADLLDARVLQPRQRAGVGHVGVEHGRGVCGSALWIGAWMQ